MNNLNPLQRIWMITSTIFGAIGIVNVTSDFYKWIPFFQQLIEQYQLIWYWFFQWIPFSIPSLIKDYFFFSLLMAVSMLKVIRSTSRSIIRTAFFYFVSLRKFLGYIVFWPITLISLIIALYIRKPPMNEGAINTYRSWLQHLGASALLFIFFLMINITIQNWPS